MKLIWFLVIVALIASSSKFRLLLISVFYFYILEGSSPVREVKLAEGSTIVVTAPAAIAVSSTQASPTTVKVVSTTAGEEDEDEVS